MKKIIFSVISIIVAIFLLTTTVCAHQIDQSTQLDTYEDEYGYEYVGSEDIGWGIMEFCHLGTNQGQYKFDSGLDSRYRTMFLAAVDLWTSSTQAAMTQSDSAIGTVVQDNYGPVFVARAKMLSGANGHLVSWEIQINTYYANSITSRDIAHEIGHIWGLNDLYSDNNINKLMYYSNNSTATAPTASDINGFNVITGIHNAHDWIYTNTRKQCTSCNGIKTERHTYVWTDYSASLHKGVCSDCSKIVYEAHARYYVDSRGCIRCLRKNPIQEIMGLLPADNETEQSSTAKPVFKE